MCRSFGGLVGCFCVLCLVSPPLPFFPSSVFDNTPLCLAFSLIERAWKAPLCFFFVTYLSYLVQLLVVIPYRESVCLFVGGAGWGFIPCFSFVLSPSSCILRPCVRLCFRVRSVPLAPSLAFLTYLFAIPLFPSGTWPSTRVRACACLRAGRGGVSYHVSPCSCLRLLAPCGLVYVCACVRRPSLWRPPLHS